MSLTRKFWKLRKSYLKTENYIIKKYCLLWFKVILAFFSSDISVTENISEFETPHGFSGIFISGRAWIGDNCTILQNVTIGSNDSLGTKKPGAPHIGNNCYIGAGATLIGGINIGNNVKIGANATVVEDVPDNCTVVSSKAYIIKKAGN